MNFLIPIAFAETQNSGILQGLDQIVPGGFANIFTFGLQIGLAIAFCTIIYSGVLFITAGDNPSKQKEAKAWIIAAVEGLLILASAYILLSVLNPKLTNVKDIEIEFIRYEEQQPLPTGGVIPMSAIPDADKGYFINKPLSSYAVSSAFGMRKLSDDAACRMHTGIDFAPTISKNDPVYATANGTVIHASVAGGYGNLIQIQDDKGYIYYFAHLSQMDYSVGTKVTAGQKIGNVGNTGYSFGEHLHYEIRNKDNAVLNINSAMGVGYPVGNSENYCYNLGNRY